MNMLFFKISKLKVSSILLIPILMASCFVVAGANVRAEEVKPLEAFCNEVGADKEVCKNSTNDPGGKSLLEADGIVDRVFRLISWLTGMLAVVFIFVGGFKFATSGGNKDSVKSARNMIIYAMVGLAVILLSNLIFNIIIGIVKGTG